LTPFTWKAPDSSGTEMAIFMETRLKRRITTPEAMDDPNLSEGALFCEPLAG